MDILEILDKKKDEKELSKEEIEFFVENYTNGKIPDYQAAALIMAICINGMTSDEILNLTIAMANSGEILDLSDISDNIVDKHSTGGIGDKITLILAPIIASLDIPVAKMSGRGLGITGGTADKLESIPGYKVNLSIEEFKENVKDIGISLITQTLNLAPADKKIYALRDTISCAKSMPLIASSIMSKKIASGANHIVLDVTCGSGAFMKTKAEAKNLAKMMNLIGAWAKRDTKCIITSMEEPLGYTVGNSLEVVEAIKALKGDMPADGKEVLLTLGAYMIKAAKKGENIAENKEKILEVIESGKAFEKFKELVKKQGGDVSYVEEPEKFEKAKFITPLISNEEGYIEKLDAKIVGQVCLDLGAGRKTKEDKIDNTVGITLVKKIGDEVNVGDVLAYIHASTAESAENGVENLQKAYKTSIRKVKKTSVILDIV